MTVTFGQHVARAAAVGVLMALNTASATCVVNGITDKTSSDDKRCANIAKAALEGFIWGALAYALYTPSQGLVMGLSFLLTAKYLEDPTTRSHFVAVAMMTYVATVFPKLNRIII